VPFGIVVGILFLFRGVEHFLRPLGRGFSVTGFGRCSGYSESDCGAMRYFGYFGCFCFWMDRVWRNVFSVHLLMHLLRLTISYDSLLDS